MPDGQHAFGFRELPVSQLCAGEINTRAVRMVGNSVSPPPLAALARANLDPVSVPERIAA